jgi:hypothetical protein
MTLAAWTADELDRIGAAEELRIAARRRDAAYRAKYGRYSGYVEPMVASQHQTR